MIRPILILALLAAASCAPEGGVPAAKPEQPLLKKLADVPSGTSALDGWQPLAVPDGVINVAVSPDGEQVVLVYSTNYQGWVAVVYKADGKATDRRLNEVLDFPPRWHFTRPLIALTQGALYTEKYCLWDLTSGKSRKVLDVAENPFAWAPDGRDLLIYGDDWIRDPNSQKGKYRLHIPWEERPLKTGPRRTPAGHLEVIEPGYRIQRITSAPDGRVLAEFAYPSGGRFLRVYRHAGPRFHFEQVAEVGGYEYKNPPDWFPASGQLLRDGRLAYVRYARRGGKLAAREVWVSPASGGPGKRWFSIPGADKGENMNSYESFSVSPDGKTAAIIYNGKAYIKRL